MCSEVTGGHHRAHFGISVGFLEVLGLESESSGLSIGLGFVLGLCQGVETSTLQFEMVAAQPYKPLNPQP